LRSVRKGDRPRNERSADWPKPRLHRAMRHRGQVGGVVLYQQLAKTGPRPLEDTYQTLRGLWKTLWRVWKSVEGEVG